MDPIVFLFLVIIVALAFDFINGFHDAANAIATSVSTGVMTIGVAVVVAGVFNFAGAFAGTQVAKTISSGFADAAIVTQVVVLSALIGASAWNLITWWFGLPSSSSHALIGGLAGAVVAHAGWGAFNWGTLVGKVLIPLILSPVLGFIAALTFMIILFWLLRRFRPATVNWGSRKMQLVSACAFAFSHGQNDAQKVMGIVTLALASYMTANVIAPDNWLHALLPVAHEVKGKLIYDVPYWVVVACAAAMGIGTMAGGKKIIKTMGSKIIHIQPIQGFAAETGGTLTILSAGALGIPVSTTHCISACILGAGASKGLNRVRWTVAFNIVAAWVITLPASGLIAWLTQRGLDAAGIKY